MLDRTALEALTRRPLPFLASAWPWRGAAYLLASLVPGAAAGVTVAATAAGFGLTPYLGVATGPAALALCVPLVAAFERLRLRLVDRIAVPKPPDRRKREAGLALMTVLALWWIDLIMLAFTAGGPVLLILTPVVQPDVNTVVSTA